MNLTKDKIEEIDESTSLERFTQGIKSKVTLDRYTRTLQRILCNYLENVLDDTFEERMRQMVTIGRETSDWTRDLLLKISENLCKRTELAKDDPDYLNPASIDNYFKPLKKLFDMNEVMLPWKMIYATYPEQDNLPDSRGWSREGISKMLRNAHDPMDRALVLVLAGVQGVHGTAESENAVKST